MSTAPKIHLRAEPGSRDALCGLSLTGTYGPRGTDDPTEATCRSCLKNHGDLDRLSRSGGSPAANWTALREAVEAERNLRRTDAIGREIAENWRAAAREHGWADALDWVLAAMDRADPSPAAVPAEPRED